MLSFFPASYIFLHIRVLTFILFHVRSNGILDSCNFSLALSLANSVSTTLVTRSPPSYNFEMWQNIE